MDGKCFDDRKTSKTPREIPLSRKRSRGQTFKRLLNSNEAGMGQGLNPCLYYVYCLNLILMF